MGRLRRMMGRRTGIYSLELAESSMMYRLVGIDCAVDPGNVGVALATLDGDLCRVLDARRCKKNELPVDVIAKWHDDAPLALLAVDAPLGWPVAMAEGLATHLAGGPLAAEPNQLFRRATDRAIHARLAKQPLDVGANFIARTAKAALDLLEALRARTSESIPLAWQAEVPADLAAIEVYPAATLRAWSLPIVSYKKSSQQIERQQMLDALPEWFDASAARDVAIASADALDAVLCVLAAVDFCQGRAVGPKDEQNTVARKEGWIWAAENISHG